MNPRFLVLCHPTVHRHFYDSILDWVKEQFPEYFPLFEIHEVPCRVTDLRPYCLHLPWLQDPVQLWSPPSYHHANAIAHQCDALHIPIINRVDKLLNASKSVAAKLLREVGIRVPRMEPIRNPTLFRDTLLGLSVPLMVREDQGHWGLTCRADTEQAARSIPVERFTNPVAIEIVDVRDPKDGLYRKFRYLAAGKKGVSHHLQISKEWVTRGNNRVIDEATGEEELAYIDALDPHHAQFQLARERLELDFLAFDYGYTPNRELVVWEVNPFPSIQFSTQSLRYRNHAIHRSMLAILRMYLARANLPIPEKIDRGVAYSSEG